MATQARFVGAGVQPLIDAVTAAGGDASDLRAVVWQATWARGYDDVVAPVPAVKLKEEGFVIFARAINDGEYAAIIDTGQALWALTARGPAPPAGARVRVSPAFGKGDVGWDVSLLEVLGLGFSVRFGAKPGNDAPWAELLQAALVRIVDAEAERRKAIVMERRSLTMVEPLRPFREELDALHEQLCARVETETAATSAERASFGRGNEKQRKAVLEECKERRTQRYNKELRALKERVPELQAAYEQRSAAIAKMRAAIAKLEDDASRSRGATERAIKVEEQLAIVQRAGHVIDSDSAVLEALGPADLTEISRTVQLLHDLTPRRALRRELLR